MTQINKIWSTDALNIWVASSKKTVSQCHSITTKTISLQSARHVFPSEFSLSLTEFSFFIAEPSLVIAESSLVMTEPSAFMADPFSLSLIFNMCNGLRPISSTESPN